MKTFTRPIKTWTCAAPNCRASNPDDAAICWKCAAKKAPSR
jgi:hypothetical protein